MVDVKLRVSFAGPFVTFQDEGRPGHMRYGVSASGPMDRLSFAAAHAALDNPQGQTCLEISLGGIQFECSEGEVTLAITGGEFSVELDGKKGTSWSVLTLSQGRKLSIRPGTGGSWAYLAFAGVLGAETWLESSATHASSGFGGGAVRSGQVLTVREARICPDREGEIARYSQRLNDPFRVVVGPQDERFEAGIPELFTSETFKVSDSYDRMGMRLIGPKLALDGALSIPSEPIVRGSVQVSGDGVPTVLLADHQTTGGYPKIATIISCDIDRLVQTRAGQSVRFVAVTAEEAIAATRAETSAQRMYLEEISAPRGTLEQRLLRENLIHGEIFP